VSEQLFLFGREAPGLSAAALEALQRRDLAGGAFIEYARHVVRGHAALRQQLERTIAWEQPMQHLYDREVLTPRLVGSVVDVEAQWPLLAEIAGWLSARYQVRFDRITCALYRNGRDSVAWHRDRNLRDAHSGYVATVSVGEPRPFLLRPHGGGPSIRLDLGLGDLLVMGGTCQRTWEHTLPKVRATAGPRISIMFRHSEPPLEPPVSAGRR
jgi:alkylated DNA repair dioxygenase AlkB